MCLTALSRIRSASKTQLDRDAVGNKSPSKDAVDDEDDDEDGPPLEAAEEGSVEDTRPMRARWSSHVSTGRRRVVRQSSAPTIRRSRT